MRINEKGDAAGSLSTATAFATSFGTEEEHGLCFLLQPSYGMDAAAVVFTDREVCTLPFFDITSSTVSNYKSILTASSLQL
jgi:hypothetical protein